MYVTPGTVYTTAAGAAIAAIATVREEMRENTRTSASMCMLPRPNVKVVKLALNSNASSAG